MVTVLLSGGLGNQMFQYAAGKALSMRLHVPLAIDLFYYDKKTQSAIRRFELDIFKADLNYRSSLKNKIYIKYKLFFLRHPDLSCKFGVFSDRDALVYDSHFNSLGDNITLAGYFQNEKYFKFIDSAIRSEFQFRNEPEGRNALVAEKLQSVNSVAVHVRRGDYLTDNNTSLMPCSLSYYEAAISLMREKSGNPCFFVFSDDPEWVKTNLDFGKSPVKYVDWNMGDASYADMQLMSLCKHNIIANSTFSWWGAWLNSNPNKIVIAPDEWFRNWFGAVVYPDYLPKDWIRL